MKLVKHLVSASIVLTGATLLVIPSLGNAQGTGKPGISGTSLLAVLPNSQATTGVSHAPTTSQQTITSTKPSSSQTGQGSVSGTTVNPDAVKILGGGEEKKDNNTKNEGTSKDPI